MRLAWAAVVAIRSAASLPRDPLMRHKVRGGFSPLRGATRTDGATGKGVTEEQERKGVALGIVALAGGCLTHVVLGSFYSIPTYVSYMSAKQQYFDPTKAGGKPDALYALSLTLLTSSMVMPFFARLASDVSAVGMSLLSGVVASLAVLLASYATECWHFLLSHGVLFGVAHALGYTSPMVIGWRNFPNRRGLVSGVILLGFGCAASVWSPLATALANPDNVAPPFPASVRDRLAPTLRTLAGIYCFVSAAGVVALALGSPQKKTPATTKQTKKDVLPHRSVVREALGSGPFWLAWGLCAMAASASLNVATLYKGFAAAFGCDAVRADDRALAVAGAVGALGNGLGRLTWAALSDVVGLKPTYLALLLVQTSAMLALGPAALTGPRTFAAVLGLIFYTLGGCFSLSPPLASALFGPVDGPQVYGMVFSAFPVASVAGNLVATSIISRLGWQALLNILAATSVLAFLPLAGLRFPTTTTSS
mmetsp:Transcript_20507/g.63379  ORF Transcript_20507/g.63379 Transcript_20507/m.63379 type:complete len:480 (+) Transcript_20507:45-1484(+)